MNTLILSPVSGRLSDWAVRIGLGLARWGRRRDARRTDRDHQLRRIAERSAAEAALAERDRMISAGTFLPL